VHETRYTVEHLAVVEVAAEGLKQLPAIQAWGSTGPPTAVPTSGTPGALWGGILAAASIDPKVFMHMR